MEQNEQTQSRIDLFAVLGRFLRCAKRLWVLALVLAVLCAALSGFLAHRSYTPMYEASVSFTVRVSNPLYAGITVYNSGTAEQMAETFPYILSSSALQQRVREHLDYDYIPQLSASVSSNIFTMTIRDTDPERAYAVLTAVMECYPDVSDFVIGPTQLVLLDDTGIPTYPVNSYSLTSSLVKGAAVGILIWAVLVLVLAITRTTIHNEADLRRMLNFPCLGLIPATKVVGRDSHCPLIHMNNTKFGFSESIRQLRLRSEKEMASLGSKILMVTGATPGEGKTTAAVNLAVSFARKGRRVLLVDCDVYNPSVAKVLNMTAQRSLSECIRQGADPADYYCDTPVKHLHSLSIDVDLKDPASQRTLSELMQRYRREFDCIIMDTPPCSLLVDAAEIAGIADCALMIIRQDYASREQILDGARLLTDSGLKLIGCAMNGVTGNLTSGGYRYGYGMGYGYGYGYGYGSSKSDSAE